MNIMFWRNMVVIMSLQMTGHDTFQSQSITLREMTEAERLSHLKNFCKKKKLSNQLEISRVALDHDIPLDLVFNLDQIPLSYVLSSRYSSIWKDPQPFQYKVSMTSVKSKQHLESQPLVFSDQFIWYAKARPKNLYQNTNFGSSFTLLTQTPTIEFPEMRRFTSKDHVSISMSERKQSLDIRKNNFHLSLWTPSKIKTTRD